MTKFQMDEKTTIYKSDALNWVVAESRPIEKGAHKGEMTEDILGYHGSFFDALKDYRNKVLSETAACTLDGYLDEMKRTDEHLASMISGYCSAIESCVEKIERQAKS